MAFVDQCWTTLVLSHLIIYLVCNVAIADLIHSHLTILCTQVIESHNVLGLKELALVLEEIYDVRSQWYNLGLLLSLSVEVLERISREYYGDPSACLREVLLRWLKSGNATWTALCEALSSRIIDMNLLSLKLREKYILPHTHTGIIIINRITCLTLL